MQSPVSDDRRNFFRLRPEQVVLVAMLAAILLLGVGIGSFFYHAGPLVSSEDEEEAISLTLSNLQEVVSFVQDAESAQRAFLLTGDAAYLKTFSGDAGEVDGEIARLRKLLAGNSAALLQLDMVNTFQKRAFAEMEQAVALKREGRDAAARAVMTSGRGTYYVRQVRSGIAAIMKTIRGDQSQINQRVAVSIDAARYSLIGLAVIVIAVLIVSYGIVHVSFQNNRRLSEDLRNQATHDALTGLPNRRFLIAWMEYALAHAKRESGKVAMCFIDLDGFKQINDRFGHEVGDRVLQSAAMCFRRLLRESDFVARFGGDEFVVVVSKAGDRLALARLADRIILALDEGMDVPIGDLAVSCSIGIACFPDDAVTLDDFLRKADKAMYQAKKQGKGCHAFLSESASSAAASKEA
jgi:diguanylate cyclase (GGDEF)-like protein